MENLLQDLPYARRTLLKSPRFTAAAILALAVGIGANTAILSLINAVLFRPLHGIENPSQLVSRYRMQKNDEFDVFDQELAQRLWPGVSAIGKRISWPSGLRNWEFAWRSARGRTTFSSWSCVKE